MKPNEIIEIILKYEKEHARKKFREYLRQGPYSESNFRYFAGYYDKETRQKLFEKVGDIIRD